jgi:hypothetical protein
MKTISTTLSLLSLMFLFGMLSAQNYKSLHISLEESSNPLAIKRQGKLRATADGGYVQAGTWGNMEYSRATITKLDSLFQPQWSYRINQSLTGGNSWQASYGVDVLPLEGERYVLLAAINQSLFNGDALQNLDYAVIRFGPDSTGNPTIAAAHRYGGPYGDYPHMIEATQDGGMVISGISNSEAGFNFPSRAFTYIVKLDSTGAWEWDQRFGSPSGGCHTGELTISNLLNKGLTRRSIVQTQDEGFVFTQYCGGNTYITKIDPMGSVLWSKKFLSNNNLFDGAFDPNWNIALGAGAGTGGTIARVREFPDGKLAFLGNHYAYFLLIFGSETGVNGGGLTLPLSYVFVTDSIGNYLYGNAFFRQTGQANFPIEFTAEDFVVLPNGQFFISCGINRYTQNNATSYRPAFMRLDPTAQNNNEAIGIMGRIKDSVRYQVQDYPWGLDPMNILYDHSTLSAVLSFDNHAIDLAYNHSVNSGPCLEEIPSGQLYSFPITLNLLAGGTPTGNSLAHAPLTLNQPTSLSLNQIEECRHSNATRLEQPDLAPGGIVLAPSVSYQDFQLLLQDPRWLQAKIQMRSLNGQLVYQGTIQSERQIIPTEGMTKGLYFISFFKDGQRLHLKGILR